MCILAGWMPDEHDQFVSGEDGWPTIDHRRTMTMYGEGTMDGRTAAMPLERGRIFLQIIIQFNRLLNTFAWQSNIK